MILAIAEQFKLSFLFPSFIKTFVFLGAFDVPTLNSKWRYLRDKYAREKRASKKLGKAANKVWEHFEELKFVDDDVVAVKPLYDILSFQEKYCSVILIKL